MKPAFFKIGRRLSNAAAALCLVSGTVRAGDADSTHAQLTLSTCGRTIVLADAAPAPRGKMAEVMRRASEILQSPQMIGQGGQAIVFRGKPLPVLGLSPLEDLVVKIFPFEDGNLADVREQAFFEAYYGEKASAKSPRVVPYVGFIDVSGNVWYGNVPQRILLKSGYPAVLMRDAGSISLDELMHSRDPIEPFEVARIIREVLESIEANQKLGIHHRDIKPSNVMIDAQNRALLADFGLATTEIIVSRRAGTPRYLAPRIVSTLQVYFDPPGAYRPLAPQVFLSREDDLYPVSLILAEWVTIALLGKDFAEDALLNPNDYYQLALPGMPGVTLPKYSPWTLWVKRGFPGVGRWNQVQMRLWQYLSSISWCWEFRHPRFFQETLAAGVKSARSGDERTFFSKLQERALIFLEAEKLATQLYSDITLVDARRRESLVLGQIFGRTAIEAARNLRDRGEPSRILPRDAGTHPYILTNEVD